MPRKKKRSKASVKTVVGIAWYTPDEWAKVRRTAVDPERLESTFEEWEAVAEDALAQLQARGRSLTFRRVLINAAALASWCFSEGCENDGAARAAFVASVVRAGSTPRPTQPEPK